MENKKKDFCGGMLVVTVRSRRRLSRHRDCPLLVGRHFLMSIMREGIRVAEMTAGGAKMKP